jgi:hypothetical protein
VPISHVRVDYALTQSKRDQMQETPTQSRGIPLQAQGRICAQLFMEGGHAV